MPETSPDSLGHSEPIVMQLNFEQRCISILAAAFRKLFNFTHRHLTASWILGIIAVIASVLVLHAEGEIHLKMLLFTLVFLLFALLIAITSISFYLDRAKEAFEATSATDSLLHAPMMKTGLKPLDDLIDFHSRKVIGLMEVINTVQANSENLLERYRILTENLAASVVIRDMNGKISYASPYTEVLTGYSLREIYASSDDFFLQTVVDEDKVKYQRSLKIAAMGESFNILYRSRHKTGMEMWFETRTEPVMNDKNEVVAYLAVTIDVTRTMRYQKQVEEKNRDLQDFAYMVSHDLKAPIFTIKGMIGLLEEDLKDKLDGDSKETLSHISKATLTLEKLVGSVLEYSRISAQETTLEEVDLKTVFSDILNDHASQIQVSGAQINVASNLPKVSGDRLKVYQIFSNLIGNALKFRDTQRPLQINVDEQHSNAIRELTISVSDNGLGIPADKLESVFRPFHRAHGKAIEGSGIGLACVKRLLEKVGGNIEVKSKEGQGSTFLVTLKRAEEFIHV